MNVICIHEITLFDHRTCEKIYIDCGTKFTIELKSPFDRSNLLTQELHGLFRPYLIGKSSSLKYEFIISAVMFYECFKELND